MEYKCLVNGDQILGNWKNKFLAFWKLTVWRKSLAANQEAQIKKQIFAGHSWGPIKPIEILLFSPPVVL